MIRIFAALAAAFAIVAGAFGAHGAHGHAAEWLKTGTAYLLPHAIAVVVLGQEVRLHRPLWLLIAGAAVFSTTLYAMAFGAPRWFGAITPLGGVAMILGWVWLAFSLPRR